MTEKETLQIMKQYDVISFDVFDTLLVRPYLKPTDLFYELEERYAMQGFAEKRVSAEQCARQKYTMQEDVALEQIYEMLEADYQVMASREVALEQEVLQANDMVKRLYHEALQMEKRIIIVSDMYLSRNVLESILKDKGYVGFEEIYVSSETGYTKASGNMYRYVLNGLGCGAEQVLHIGDNLRSDGNACRCVGMGYLFVSDTSPRIIECRTIK